VCSHLFQTDKEPELMMWVTAIQTVCERLVLSEIGGKATHSKSLSLEAQEQAERENDEMREGQEAILAIRALDGNSVCADCSEENPEWASINLGVFICIDCSGVHRSFGTHISKVRSIELDKWEPEHIEVMRTIGNINANKEWEFRIPDGFTRINKHSIKYVQERERERERERESVCVCGAV
jgi:Arf-GAP with coiled-coil, ANK repeat and PH domain-containing protein